MLKAIITAIFTTSIATLSAAQDTNNTGWIGLTTKTLNDKWAGYVTGDFFDRHETGSAGAATAYRLNERDLITFTSGATLYAPFRLTRKQEEGEPNYAGRTSFYVGWQRDTETMNYGAYVGIDSVNDLAETVQMKIHESGDGSIAADDLIRETNRNELAFGASVDTELYTFDAFTLQGHARTELGYMDTATAGGRLWVGTVPTIVGHGRAAGLPYAISEPVHTRTWSAYAGLEKTWQLDVPHLGDYSTDSFITTSAGAYVPVLRQVDVYAEIAHMSKKYQDQALFGKAENQITAGFGISVTF